MERWRRGGSPPLNPVYSPWAFVELVAAMAIARSHWFSDGQQDSQARPQQQISVWEGDAALGD